MENERMNYDNNPFAMGEAMLELLKNQGK